MPFNCFSSSAHDSLPRHYTPYSAQPKPASSTAGSNGTSHRPPYSTAALPPLQASTRRRRSVHGLTGGASVASLSKDRIGSPVGFRHLAHGGAEGDAEAGMGYNKYARASIDVLSRTPSPSPSPSSHAPPTRRISLDPSLVLRPSPLHTPSHLSPLSPTRSHSHPPDRHLSSSAPSSPTRPRPQSHLPPAHAHAHAHAQARARTSRKPPPQITASVIRQAGGVERVRETGGVPSRLGGTGAGAVSSSAAGSEWVGRVAEGDGEGEGKGAGTAGSVLEGWFTPSELQAVNAAMAGALLHDRASPDAFHPREGLEGVSSPAEPRTDAENNDDDDGPAYETNTTKAFRGAMADIEAALRADAAADQASADPAAP